MTLIVKSTIKMIFITKVIKLQLQQKFSSLIASQRTVDEGSA